MTRTHAKLLAAGLVLSLAVGYLAVAGVRSGWVYFIDVDKYLAETQFHSQRVRLHGTVGTENFEMSSAHLVARFQLLGDRGAVPVVYRGNIPEMFGTAKSVVVEGRRDADGVFQADVLMTKCASKYEPGSPHAESNP